VIETFLCPGSKSVLALSNIMPICFYLSKTFRFFSAKKFVAVLETVDSLSEAISTHTTAVVVWSLTKIAQVTASFYYKLFFKYIFLVVIANTTVLPVHIYCIASDCCQAGNEALTVQTHRIHVKTYAI
jgi:hypothetical protein